MKLNQRIHIYEEGKIDIHQRELTYERMLKRVQSDPSLPATNRELILRFVRDCILGKTAFGKGKKRIGHSRCEKYLRLLSHISGWFGKSFNDVTQPDMESLIERLESNEIIARTGKLFSEATKVDYRRCIKKFWKWKDGQGKYYPDLVEWIDTNERMGDVPAITKSEVENLIEFCTTLRDKTFIMVLFDSGARIEELLNVRLKPEHVVWKADIGVYKIRLEFSKTKPRTISLPLSTSFLRRWLNAHPARDTPQAQLFPISYANARQIVSRQGRKILGKRVTPHMLRHSSATYYANKLNRYQLCYRYGWTMSSKVVDRYLDREGILEEGVTEKVRETEVAVDQKRGLAASEDMLLLREANSDLAAELGELRKQLALLKSGRGASDPLWG